MTYAMTSVIFSEPILDLESEALLISHEMYLLDYELYYSDKTGYFLSHDNAVLHFLSSSEVRVLNGAFWAALALSSLCFVTWSLKHTLSSRFSSWLPCPSKESPSSQKTTLLAYASQTGGGQKLAYQLQKMANSLFEVRCTSSLEISQLAQYQRVFFIVSTYGDGAPPDSAQSFIKKLRTTEWPLNSPLPRFSVLALGDKTYKTFCAFGHALSTLLKQQGLKQELPTQEVDKMDMGSVNHWWEQVCHLLAIKSSQIKRDTIDFTVCENQHLNTPKHDRAAHFIRLQSNGIEYDAGDLVAIYPEISTDIIQERLSVHGWSGTETVQQQNTSMSLAEALIQLDWCQESAKTPQELVDLLPPIHERLYSIACYENDYVDLLVRKHQRLDSSIGNGSGYLCRLQEGDLVKAQLRKNDSFKLSGDYPIIMIAAGTGIAPFRGFLQQKQKWNSTNEHWLIFGEQDKRLDDYFAKDIEDFQASGLLTHVDKAWSRSDQTYVQAILGNKSNLVREWVNNKGAQIYICGSQVGFGEQVIEKLSRIVGEETLSHCLHTDLY
ncbi:flavodoxin domain-containing protein [Marinomonas sp. 2405UD66-6]|uniref:flavodoxin domain-containing protein n=1 Tax=Marinomonas sp. 2405UD66-6 TaxID=3391834 RepID=UPI0039C95510